MQRIGRKTGKISEFNEKQKNFFFKLNCFWKYFFCCFQLPLFQHLKNKFVEKISGKKHLKINRNRKQLSEDIKNDEKIFYFHIEQRKKWEIASVALNHRLYLEFIIEVSCLSSKQNPCFYGEFFFFFCSIPPLWRILGLVFSL